MKEKLKERATIEDIKGLVGMTVVNIETQQKENDKLDSVVMDLRNKDGNKVSVSIDPNEIWVHKKFDIKNMLSIIIEEFNLAIDDKDKYFVKDLKLMHGIGDEAIVVCDIEDIEEVSIIDKRIILKGEKLGELGCHLRTWGPEY